MSESTAQTPSHYLLKLQLYNHAPHFGRGLVSLMLLIRQGHSLRSASQEMHMAYSKAWRLLRKAEEDLGFPLLATKKGGSSRAGSSLTPDGDRLLEEYLAFEADVREAADALFARHFPSL